MLIFRYTGNADQPGKFFDGYHDHHFYFLLYMFCGRHLLFNYLRTSNRSDGHCNWAILALLVLTIQWELKEKLAETFRFQY